LNLKLSIIRMNYSKEIKIGIISITALILLVAGINFLKGNSFFGGDDSYHLYLPESGGLTAAASVYVNGVSVGKVTNVQLNKADDPNKRVVITFNIQDRNFKIPTKSLIYTGNADLLNRGLIIEPNQKSTHYHKPEDFLQGTIGASMFADIQDVVDPLMLKITTLANTVDLFVSSLSTYWDTTANIELTNVFSNVQSTLIRFNSVASQLDGLLSTEKIKMMTILNNVESITSNLQKSNEVITKILENALVFTNDFALSEFKELTVSAHAALNKFNSLLDATMQGNGTLGKLLNDEQLYTELNSTNQQLQDLLADFEKHPERYIHISVFGAKTKGVPLSASEEKKLKHLLDSLPAQK